MSLTTRTSVINNNCPPPPLGAKTKIRSSTLNLYNCFDDDKENFTIKVFKDKVKVDGKQLPLDFHTSSFGIYNGPSKDIPDVVQTILDIQKTSSDINTKCETNYTTLTTNYTKDINTLKTETNISIEKIKTDIKDTNATINSNNNILIGKTDSLEQNLSSNVTDLTMKIEKEVVERKIAIDELKKYVVDTDKENYDDLKSKLDKTNTEQKTLSDKINKEILDREREIEDEKKSNETIETNLTTMITDVNNNLTININNTTKIVNDLISANGIDFIRIQEILALYAANAGTFAETIAQLQLKVECIHEQLHDTTTKLNTALATSDICEIEYKKGTYVYVDHTVSENVILTYDDKNMITLTFSDGIKLYGIGSDDMLFLVGANGVKTGENAMLSQDKQFLVWNNSIRPNWLYYNDNTEVDVPVPTGPTGP